MSLSKRPLPNEMFPMPNHDAGNEQIKKNIIEALQPPPPKKRTQTILFILAQGRSLHCRFNSLFSSRIFIHIHKIHIYEFTT